MNKLIAGAGAIAFVAQVTTIPTAGALPLAGGAGGQTPAGCVAQSFTPVANNSGTGIVPSPTPADLGTAMLNIHNAERRAVGVPDLTWDNGLAAAAQTWATHLINRPGDSTGARYALIHDKAAENLSGGDYGAHFTATQLAQGWVNEKPGFKDNVFPDVSITCNWAAVGHYTQMVWRDTTKVGCALATDARARILVCRYSPPGNMHGQRVLVSNAGAPSAQTAPAPTAATAPEPDFRTAMLAANNDVRGPKLAWDDALATAAAAEAEKRMNEATPNARSLGGGETMAYGWNSTADTGAYPSAGPLFAGAIPSGNWQRGVASNVAWTKVGCGTVTRRVGGDNRRVVICRYG